MYKNFDTLGFKPGDTVKCLKSDYKNMYEVGKTYKLIEGKTNTIIPGRWTGFSAEWEKVEEMEFEDQWHLNDGKVTIPDDADKLEKDGSVVAFRKRKVVPLEFGDELLDKYTGRTYRFISYYGSRKDNINVLSDKDDIVQGVELILFRQK